MYVFKNWFMNLLWKKGEEEEVSVLSQGEEEEEEEEGFFDDWTFVNDEELEIS